MHTGELARLRQLGINPANITVDQALRIILQMANKLESAGVTFVAERPAFPSGKALTGEPNRGQP
jgi:hypothetical protein